MIAKPIAAFSFFVITLGALCYSQPALAQQKPNDGIERFYEPASSDKLVTILPKRQNNRSRFSDGTSFIDGQNGCPDTIQIGSVDSDTPIFGNVDINVVLQNDIFIDCGDL